MGYGAVKFNLASKAADDIYLTLVQDSVIAGAKGADKAVELRLMEGADWLLLVILFIMVLRL